MTLLPLTTAEYKEVFSYFLDRYRGRENTNECISKHLSQLALRNQEGLRILMIGPGAGEIELKLLSSHKINHLTAVEPNLELTDELEINLRSSSSFIKEWKIERTKLESYLMNKSSRDDPFDIILMIHSVYYLPSRADLLYQIRSLLQPKTGQLVMVATVGCFNMITCKYIPSSKHVYDADDLEHDLRDVDIPFERYMNNVTIDLTGVKGDDKLEWAFASFFLAVNVANDAKNLATKVIDDLLNITETTNDGKLEIKLREDVFVVRSID